MPRRHVAIAVLVALTWGVNFVVLHVGLESFPPLLFTGLRFLLVALLIPFVPRPGVGVRWVIVVGLFMSAGHHGLVTLGLHEGMPAGLASLVLQLQAAFTIGFAVLLIGEQPARGAARRRRGRARRASRSSPPAAAPPSRSAPSC